MTSTTQQLPVPPSLTSMCTKQLECFIYIVFTIAISTYTVIFTGTVSPAKTTASSIKQGDSVYLDFLHLNLYMFYYSNICLKFYYHIYNFYIKIYINKENEYLLVIYN